MTTDYQLQPMTEDQRELFILMTDSRGVPYSSAELRVAEVLASRYGLTVEQMAGVVRDVELTGEALETIGLPLTPAAA